MVHAEGRDARIAELERRNAELEHENAALVATLASTEPADRGLLACLRWIIGGAPIALAVVDRGRRYLAVSRKWATDYDVIDSDVVGRRDHAASQLLPSRWWEAHERALAGEAVTMHEERWDRDDGSVRWLSWRVWPWQTSCEPVHVVLVLVEDITDRKRAHERECDSFYRQMLESIPGMIFTASPAGSCDYASEKWAELTGVPTAELLGEGWVSILHPQDRMRTLAAWRATVEGRGQYDLEYRVRRKDGAYEWFKVRCRAIRDAAGAVRWLGMAVNVDDLKRAEAAVLAREQELESLAENIPDAVCRVDRQLRFVFANAAIEAATGLRPEEIVGKTNLELGMPPDLCDLWDSSLRAVLEQRQPRSVEFALEGPSGLRHYAARLVPEPGPSGEVEHVLAVTHDVTDIKRAQEALEDAHRHKDQFLATLAHELRNPLAPLCSGLEILRRSGLATEAQVRAHQMMERQLSHLVRLVDDLLDVARISRGMMEIKLQRIEVRAILDLAVETTRPMIEARGHAFTVHVPDASVWVNGDLTRLAQVVGNLLVNAAKYTPKGGHIELRAEVEDGDAIVRVADDGNGITAEMLPRVFDLFAQGDRSMHRTQGGLGIGLSLARRLVELHGGSIVAESPGPGRGSTFTVRLPLCGDDEYGRPPPAQQAGHSHVI